MSTSLEQNKAIVLMCLHEFSQTSPQMALEANGLSSKTGLSPEEINDAVRLLKEEGLVWVYIGTPHEPYFFDRAEITTKGEYRYLNEKPTCMPNPKKVENKVLTKWFLGMLDKEKHEEEKKKAETMFDEIITHPAIKRVSRNHFNNGEYRSAVLDQ